jgi:hypothetical protein
MRPGWHCGGLVNHRAPRPLPGARFRTSSPDERPFNALTVFRCGANTRINRHLDLVTAIFTRPEMTDFTFAQVRRPLRCDQQVVAFGARHSIGRANVDPSGGHDHLPYFFGFSWRGEIKHYDTPTVNLWMNGALPQKTESCRSSWFGWRHSREVGQRPDSEQFRSAPRTSRPLCGRLQVRKTDGGANSASGRKSPCST